MQPFFPMLVVGLLGAGCSRQGAVRPVEPQPPTDATRRRAAVLVNLSFHLEGRRLRSDDQFQRYASQLVQLSALGIAHGARFTFEAKRLLPLSVARADDTLLRLQEAGHAVEVHADLWGAINRAPDQARAVAALQRSQRQLEALGLSASHVSGICADVDWIEAAVQAGFRSTSSAVGWCAQGLDADLRPDGYDGCKTPAQCHERFLPFEKAVSPWRTEQTARWTEAVPDGRFVIVPAAVNLPCAAEQQHDPAAVGCAFTEADLDAYTDLLEAALDIAAPDRLTVLSATWSMGQAPEEALFEAWLERIAAYAVRGEVAWATVPEITERVLLRP